KPSLEQINHFLRPLVDDLLQFWQPGVYISRTALYPRGRLVRCAVIPLVCDLPVARQVSGHGSFGATFFCSFCKLKLDEIENFERSTWPRRDAMEHRRRAEQWKAAETPEARAQLFKAHGVRWSELLRLPYWDSITFTVVDTMHNQYLGLLKTHCKDIWGMDIDVEDGDGTYVHDHKVPAYPSDAEMSEGLRLLHNGSIAKLAKCTKAMLAQIHEDMQRTQIPSWVNPAPFNIGTEQRGKLHADQWLSACSINFPITLVRLWGNERESSRKASLLSNFMDLVTVVTMSSSLEVSAEHIKIYDASLMRYLRTLKDLYKEAAIKPNHHLALHVSECLRVFGPARSIRTFFAERMNYLLMRQNTSGKFG
ncbi:uncharacterized protein LAESUDRAFT_601594, partial [Laetiporus sulphureus 93-53]